MPKIAVEMKLQLVAQHVTLTLEIKTLQLFTSHWHFQWFGPFFVRLLLIHIRWWFGFGLGSTENFCCRLSFCVQQNWKSILNISRNTNIEFDCNHVNQTEYWIFGPALRHRMVWQKQFHAIENGSRSAKWSNVLRFMAIIIIYESDSRNWHERMRRCGGSSERSERDSE